MTGSPRRMLASCCVGLVGMAGRLAPCRLTVKLVCIFHPKDVKITDMSANQNMNDATVESPLDAMTLREAA